MRSPTPFKEAPAIVVLSFGDIGSIAEATTYIEDQSVVFSQYCSSSYHR
jgi:hypothetical protein